MDYTPGFDRMQELFIWVARETDALCPEHDRLSAYIRDGKSSGVEDLAYHVRDVMCPFCQVAIGLGNTQANTSLDACAIPNDSSPFFDAPTERDMYQSEGDKDHAGQSHPDAKRLAAEFWIIFKDEQKRFASFFEAKR